MRRIIVLLAAMIGLIGGAAAMAHYLSYDHLVGRWAAPELGRAR